MMIFRVIAVLLALTGAAVAQSGQIPSGRLWGNPGATSAVASPATLTSIIDRAMGSTRGSILFRNATVWTPLTPGAAGLPLLSGGAGADVAYGVLGLSGGGCNAALTASNGGILYSTASACAILAGTATAGQMLRSGASAAPSWSTSTWPATVAQGDVLFGSAANVVSSLAKDANATRYISNTGASNSPAWAQVNLTNGVTGVLPVANGGLGIGSGTSGGLVYFSAAGTLASSGAMTVNQIMVGGGAGNPPSTFACATGTTLVHGGTPPTCSQLAYADILSAALATANEYAAGTASKLVPASVIYPTEPATTYGTTTTFDMSTFINTSVTLTGNITTMNVTNPVQGKGGTIRFVQSGAGSFTSVFNTIFKFAGGTVPTLTTGSATAIDVLTFYCQTTAYCTASLAKDVK